MFRASRGVSASDIRTDMADFESYRKALPDFLTDTDLAKIKGILFG